MAARGMILELVAQRITLSLYTKSHIVEHPRFVVKANAYGDINLAAVPKQAFELCSNEYIFK